MVDTNFASREFVCAHTPPDEREDLANQLHTYPSLSTVYGEISESTSGEKVERCEGRPTTETSKLENVGLCCHLLQAAALDITWKNP